jgi:phosphopantothenoylcysteine decarboxylase / phosphopantothenate---cysteine ligase
MRNAIENKSVILAVGGGIAAYKSVEILRLLKKQQADVRVIMTQNAQRFVGVLTFEALSGRSVFRDMFAEGNEASFRHIDWAQETDGVIIAPATADIIGKLANGIADDALSTFMLVVRSPVLLCPSMNTRMYESKAVQRNLDTLRSDGYVVLEPGFGQLACGTTGPGRLPEPEEIIDRFLGCLSSKDFKGKKILVTAGPTVEPIDPVRFISNPASGKMGFAIATAAEHRGAEVVLVSGPTRLRDPINVTIIKIRTADEMARAVFEQMDHADVIIKSAAVSDYSPEKTEAHKIKKERNELVLRLQPTLDILKTLGQQKKNQILVGFAAETRELEKNATQKLAEKNLDIIAGNLVGACDSGFESDTNSVTLFFKDGSKEVLPLMEKMEIAHILLDRIRDKVLGTGATQPSEKNQR